MKLPGPKFHHLATVAGALRVFALRPVAAIACAVILTCLGAVPSHADERVALIIGNGAYAHAPHLPNPTHDAEDVAAALTHRR